MQKGIVAVLLAAILAGPVWAGLIQPSNLVYQGAFRLPTARYSGDVDPSSREVWSYGGQGLAFNPNGDPNNSGGGPTGSLFGTCHAQIGWIGEISIPAPVISATKKAADLNVATQLQNFYKGGAGASGLAYLPAQGSQTGPKLYTTSVGASASATPLIRWDETTLNAIQTQGPWYVKTPAGVILDIRAAQNYVAPIPATWAAANTGGRCLLIGGGLESSRAGPTLVAIGPWLDGNPPAANGSITGINLLAYQNVAGKQMTGYSTKDIWNGAAWLTVLSDSAVVLFGTKDIGGGTMHAYALFFNPADLAAVAAGTKNPWEPQPFATLDLDSYMFGAHNIYDATYDSVNGLLYLSEGGSSADGSRPIIHVFYVNVPAPTMALAPTSLTFTEHVSDPVPAAQSVTVQNTDIGTLGWTATVRAPAPAWISLSNATGTDNESFTVNVNWQGMTPGTYTAYVDITDSGARNSPRSLPVTLQVLPDPTPAIQLTPTSLSFVGFSTDALPAAKSVQVQNSGGVGSLYWSAAVRAPAPAWLTLGSTSGTDNDSFTVSVNWQGLFPGNYTAYVDVTDAGANNSPQTVTVSVQVYEQQAASDITVLHVTSHVSGWRGATGINLGATQIDNWPASKADALLADFDRATLQNAISTAGGSQGGYKARLVVTQINWGTQGVPADLAPVIGCVDVESASLAWRSSTAYNAGAGSWMFAGTNYGSFAEAVTASAAGGASYVVDTPVWTPAYKPASVSPMSGVAYWDVMVDVPPYVIAKYLDNSSAEGLFISAKRTTGFDIFGNDQWSKAGDMRLIVSPSPSTAPWLVTDVKYVNRILALTSPTASVPVQVTNAGSGTTSWTAAVSPAASWVSLTDASGASGDSFQINVDVSSLAAGNHSATVVLTDPTAANTGLSIPVFVKVLQAPAPVLQPSPAALAFNAITGATVPASRSVCVVNAGLGTTQWTAAVQPGAEWLSVSSGSGSDGDSFTASVNQAGLAAGIYTGSILVSDATALNSFVTMPVTLTVSDQDADITKANAYDDAWQTGKDGWVIAMRNLHRGWTGSNGFVLLLGDSITYANPFGGWARGNGNGKTAADTAICDWMHATVWGDGTNNSINGWYLAAYDVSGRNGSFTARSGITSAQYVAGTYGLPSLDKMITPGNTNPDGRQYTDAEMAVILLGTNDLGGSTAAALSTNLGTICDKLVAQKMIPILTTLPPNVSQTAKVGPFNDAIRSLAQARKIPLIDLYAEMMRRRPGTTWQGVLIASDGVHPTASGSGYTSTSDPYANSGAAMSSVGYLLRDWLTVQKIAEVKAMILDAPTGDIDGDGHVNVVDLLTLAAAWATTQGDANFDPQCDLYVDGKVDVMDLLILALDWNT